MCARHYKKSLQNKLADFVSDLDRIQTCNLLSRNQMRYSVAPRGRFSVCKYSTFLFSLTNESAFFPNILCFSAAQL